jgi:alpha-glucuronidase
MGLRDDAVELGKILSQVVIGLENYNKDSRGDYTKGLANGLKPLVTAYVEAVARRSKEEAKLQASLISEIMEEVNAAATKGEIDFIDSKYLDKYWDLATIFRESRYRSEGL